MILVPSPTTHRPCLTSSHRRGPRRIDQPRAVPRASNSHALSPLSLARSQPPYGESSPQHNCTLNTLSARQLATPTAIIFTWYFISRHGSRVPTIESCSERSRVVRRDSCVPVRGGVFRFVFCLIEMCRTPNRTHPAHTHTRTHTHNYCLHSPGQCHRTSLESAPQSTPLSLTHTGDNPRRTPDTGLSSFTLHTP